MGLPKIKTTEQAIELLLTGGVGVLPTDTVYGLVARAADPTAVARLYALKHREHKPGTLIAASVEQLVGLGIKKRYLTAVEQWWPNPLSVVIPTGEELGYLHLGLDSLAIRIPKDAAFIQTLERTGPLLSSSANHPGEQPADTVDEAYAFFGDSVDFYVDGGDLSGRPPSTVIRIVDDAIEVLRLGAVKISETGRIEPN
jgi:L-threonylcarbamoyladenylate synthase